MNKDKIQLCANHPLHSTPLRQPDPFHWTVPCHQCQERLWHWYPAGARGCVCSSSPDTAGSMGLLETTLCSQNKWCSCQYRKLSSWAGEPQEGIKLLSNARTLAISILFTLSHWTRTRAEFNLAHIAFTWEFPDSSVATFIWKKS